jgi:hypothetical protein
LEEYSPEIGTKVLPVEELAEPGVARDHERKINECSAKSNPIFLAAQGQKMANSRFSMPGWLHNHTGKRRGEVRARLIRPNFRKENILDGCSPGF